MCLCTKLNVMLNYFIWKIPLGKFPWENSLGKILSGKRYVVIITTKYYIVLFSIDKCETFDIILNNTRM